MKISAQTATSAEAATRRRTPSPRSRAAAYSPIRTIASSAAMKGRSVCVAIDKARASGAAAALATQTTDARLRFHASAEAAQTNAPSTAAVAAAGNTLKRRVSSQSMGARIKADVQA